MTEFKKKIQRFLLYPFLGKTYLQWLFRPLRVLASKGMHFGGGSVFGRSGELYVLRRARRLADQRASGRPFVLFDVGANTGEYAAAAAGVFSGTAYPVTLYAFEPSHLTYQKLERVAAAHPAMRTFNIGLSSREGSDTLFFNREHSVTSSLHKGNLVNFGLSVDEEETITLQTLDVFCREQGVARIDFLKLDVEGHELEVLKGARGLLAGRAISAIQFEIGRTNIGSRTFFRDYYDLLHRDFTLYRILKNGLASIPEYNEFDEVFMTTNYLAELK